MKYKRLTKGELKALENEFINFLSSAQITAKDWEQMKVKELEKAEELVDVFSDMVYEKVLGKIQYLEYRDKSTLNIYHFLDDKIILVGLRVDERSSIDLTAGDLVEQWMQSNKKEVTVIKSEKKYESDRGTAVFELLQNGCFITDEKLFKTINQM
jgi:hypothetical protein